MISSVHESCCFAAGVLDVHFGGSRANSNFCAFESFGFTMVLSDRITNSCVSKFMVYFVAECSFELMQGTSLHLCYSHLPFQHSGGSSEMDQQSISLLKMSALLITVLGIFAAIALISLEYFSSSARQIFVGYLTVASLISMFASPLFIINLVIRTKSVEFMPFYLSLATFLMSFSFFMYGFLGRDAFIYVPNGIGTLLGIAQLVIYVYYSRQSRKDVRTPLLVSHQ
ncbi:Bidirectional sugar transporter [Nymphaea thermarum]|nr:Bidirectional sugar transporter [Nymphaea thermarum]